MKRIPIKFAKEYAQKAKQDQIIVLSLETTGPDAGTVHVVTYGKTLADCDQAAIIGNNLKRDFLKWPEALCNDKPKRKKK